jgi:hypothetical protein
MSEEEAFYNENKYQLVTWSYVTENDTVDGPIVCWATLDSFNK